jgi:hypothetical protein
MLKFELHEKVRLSKEIHKDLTGIVVSIWITERAIQYEVRYFWECKIVKDAYFYEWELEKYEDKID